MPTINEAGPRIESQLSKVVIEGVPPVHEDGRRIIVEFQNDEKLPFRNMRVIRVNSPETNEEFRLGNHYHEDAELFFLEEGRIDTLVLEDPDTKERQVYRDITANTKILLPPNIAHLFIFTEAAKLLAFNEQAFNPKNFIAHQIEYPKR